MREAHFPGRAQLDAYGNGGFRFSDMSHRGSILCLPSGIFGWKHGEKLVEADFEKVVQDAADIEVLLIGTGEMPVPFAASLANFLRENGLRFDIMTTGAAVRTYNVLLAEERAVAAAFVAV